MNATLEEAKKEFLRVAHETEIRELGLFINDDGKGVFTFDGAFDLDQALTAAIEASSRAKTG